MRDRPFNLAIRLLRTFGSAENRRSRTASAIRLCAWQQTTSFSCSEKRIGLRSCREPLILSGGKATTSSSSSDAGKPKLHSLRGELGKPVKVLARLRRGEHRAAPLRGRADRLWLAAGAGCAWLRLPGHSGNPPTHCTGIPQGLILSSERGGLRDESMKAGSQPTDMSLIHRRCIVRVALSDRSDRPRLSNYP